MHRAALIGAAFLSVLTYGFCLPLIATHLPRLQQVFDLSIATSGLIAGAMAGGFVLATLGGGWLADAVGLTRMVGVGLFGMAGGLATLGLASGLATAAPGAFFLGVGAGFAEISDDFSGPLFFKSRLADMAIIR